MSKSNDSNNAVLKQENLKAGESIIDSSKPLKNIYKIVDDIEESYSNIKIREQYDDSKRFMLSTRGVISYPINNNLTRLEARLLKAFDKDRKENTTLTFEQQEFLVEKVASFLTSRPVHQFNLSEDCLNKKAIAKIAILSSHPALVIHQIIDFKRLEHATSNCYIPDYNKETKEEYKKALKECFESARGMNADELVNETKRLKSISQSAVINPLNNNIQPVDVAQVSNSSEMSRT